jgi:hypothetical protein
MPVQTPHPDYAFRKPDWQKVRAFTEGARIVRGLGETYLPKPSGWKDSEYNSYRARAEVYGAVDRTIDGLDGAIFRKAPQIEVPAGSDDVLKDITLSGKTAIEWIRDVVREVLTPGRHGALVEFSGVVGAAGAPNPVPTGGERPYVVSYTAEQIINWETANIDGTTKLVKVVLEEVVAQPSAADEFIVVYQTRYRVLRLRDRQYVVELWSATAKSAQQSIAGGPAQTVEDLMFEKMSETIPQRRGQLLDFIPFFFFGVSGQSVAPEKPPLLDVTDLCILHYMTSADYAHGLHWVGLPTPWVTGMSTKDKFEIGPSSAIVLEDPNAKVGMLEFTGTGLSAVKDRLDGLERKMAALGARILEEQKSQAESGTAIKLRQSGDASVLAGISDAVSRACEAVLACMLWWHGSDKEQPDVTVALNMEFFGSAMDPQLLTALMQTWQAGGISKETFLWNLKKGEMLPEDRTIEDELAKISTEPPPAMQTAPSAGIIAA